MKEVIGSLVENLLKGLDWLFYSMPVIVWVIVAAAAARLIFWAITADSSYELSSGRSFHSLASSMPLAFLFMLHKEAIHTGGNVYAFVTLAKKGMEFAPGDPGTWHFTFSAFLILLVVCTLFGLILSLAPSPRQLMLFVGIELAWAVAFRLLMFVENIFLIGGFVNFFADILMFFATPVGMLYSVLYMFSAPKDDLSLEQKREDYDRYNSKVLMNELPEMIVLPSGGKVYKYVDYSRESVRYYYENRHRAFSVAPSDLRIDEDGNSFLRLKLNEFDDDPTDIPLKRQISPMKFVKND